MSETYLSWCREGRMDESEFRSVTNYLAESGLTVEHPMLGCGMLELWGELCDDLVRELDEAGGRGGVPPRGLQASGARSPQRPYR